MIRLVSDLQLLCICCQFVSPPPPVRRYHTNNNYEKCLLVELDGFDSSTACQYDLHIMIQRVILCLKILNA